MTATEQQAPAGVERVIAVAMATYLAPDPDVPGKARALKGMMGERVFVHPEHVARFDELNRPPRFRDIVDVEDAIVDVRKPTQVEKRVAKGFGTQPMSADAQVRILAAEEAAREVAESTPARKSRS